jgi:hypothetical protein
MDCHGSRTPTPDRHQSREKALVIAEPERDTISGLNPMQAPAEPDGRGGKLRKRPWPVFLDIEELTVRTFTSPPCEERGE